VDAIYVLRRETMPFKPVCVCVREREREKGCVSEGETERLSECGW